MNAEKYKKSFTAYMNEARFLRFVVIALIAIVLLTVVTMINKDRPAIIVQPATLTEQATVAQNFADPIYYRAWGQLLAAQMGNLHPDNMQQVVQQVSPLLDSRIRRTVVEQMEAEVAEMRRQNLTISFREQQVTALPNGVVYVTGIQTRNTRVSDPEPRPYTYEFHFEIQFYRLIIRHIESYAGEPRR